MDFLKECKNLIIENGICKKEEDIYLVWHTKILKNYKGTFVAKPTIGFEYYEITYNGDSNKFYLDCYQKIKQRTKYRED